MRCLPRGMTHAPQLQRRHQLVDGVGLPPAAARSEGLDVHDVQYCHHPQVVPGETALAFFRARNPTDHAITGVSTYNVAPQQAGAHFNKVQCFCFEEQRLQPGVR